MLQRSGRAAGLIELCLPPPAKAPPSGPDWLHEIKHNGFRILARRDAASVRLYARNGNDLSKRFPLVVAAIATLPARSCLIDGEAIVSDGSGLAVFGHGDIVYQQACRLGCEGIVSKRLGSAYRSGRSKHWLKVKNTAVPAVRRETEEQWRR